MAADQKWPTGIISTTKKPEGFCKDCGHLCLIDVPCPKCGFIGEPVGNGQLFRVMEVLEAELDPCRVNIFELSRKILEAIQ